LVKLPKAKLGADGAVRSTWTSWVFVASALPTLSIAAYFTVVVDETVKGPV
jgi:hypothetical protein